MAETVISLQLGEACWLTIQLVPEYDRSFEYDLVGNAVGGSRGPAEFYSNFLTGNGSSTFDADSDGFGETIKEITGDKVKSYAYRADGKISAFQSGSLSVNYFYDGLDRLVAKVMNQGGTVFTNTFTHLADENRVLLGKAGNGSVTTYIDGQSVAERLGEVENGVSKGYITDHLGSVLNSVPAGDWKTFGLFGEVYANISNTPAMNPVMFAWQGLKYDSITGGYDNEARQYNQKTGTFTSQDPIGFLGGINVYGSRGNNPIIYLDMSGEAPMQAKTICTLRKFLGDDESYGSCVIGVSNFLLKKDLDQFLKKIPELNVCPVPNDKPRTRNPNLPIPNPYLPKRPKGSAKNA